MQRLAILIQRILPPLWCGMVLAIGFLEAPLKFRAPGVTREIGLGIGKLVFSALNAVEIGFAIVLTAALLAFVSTKIVRFLFGLLWLVLLLQTFWLIPILIDRADAIINGSQPGESSVHFFYVAFEVVKIILLLTLSVLPQWAETSRTGKI